MTSSSSSSFLYLDDDANIQGPFTRDELVEWRSLGYFTDQTKVYPHTEGAPQPEKSQFQPFATYFAVKNPTVAAASSPAAAAVVQSKTNDQPSAASASKASDPAPAAAAAATATVMPPSRLSSTSTQLIPPPPPPRPSTATSEPSPVSSTSPAAPSTSVAPAASTQWYYLDDSSTERGPYPSTDMAAWFNHGFFTLKTKVRTASEKTCEPLGDRTSEMETFVPNTATAAATAASTSTSTDAAAAPAAKSVSIEDEFEVDMMDEEEDANQLAFDEEGDDLSEEDEKMADEDEKKQDEAKEEEEKIPVDKLPWYYRDKQGIIRGPFTPVSMLKWHRLGYFSHNSTPLRREDEKELLTLDERKEAPSYYTAIPPRSSRTLENRWYYLDIKDVEHGPFTEDQMRQWYEGGFLKNDLRVRQVGEDENEFVTIEKRGEECAFTKPKPKSLLPTPVPLMQYHPPYTQPYSQQPYPYAAAPYAPLQQPYPHAYPAPYPADPYAASAPYQQAPLPHPPPQRQLRTDYTQTAVFNKRGPMAGRGFAAEQELYSHIPPKDSDLRQMNHYGLDASKLDQWQVEMNKRQEKIRQQALEGRGKR